MYNMERAQRIGHGDGCCFVYPGKIETNEHIFFHCIKAHRGWAATTIYYEDTPQDNTILDANSIIDIIDNSLQKTLQGTAKLFVIYHTCWTLWSQRNDRMYSAQRPTFSPRITADQAQDHIEVATKYSNSHKKKMRLKKAATLILPSRTE